MEGRLTVVWFRNFPPRIMYHYGISERMQISVSTTRTDEIGLLVHSFNDMMARIRQLVEITYNNERENKE